MERGFSRIKDEFLSGQIRVRGAKKVMARMMTSAFAFLILFSVGGQFCRTQMGKFWRAPKFSAGSHSGGSFTRDGTCVFGFARVWR